MKNYLFGLLVFFVVSSRAFGASQYDNRLKACEVEAQPEVCVALVLAEAIERLTPNVTNNGIYCKCLKSTDATLRLVRVVPGQLSEVIGFDLSPQTCINALRFPPCT